MSATQIPERYLWQTFKNDLTLTALVPVARIGRGPAKRGTSYPCLVWEPADPGLDSRHLGQNAISRVGTLYRVYVIDRYDTVTGGNMQAIVDRVQYLLEQTFTPVAITGGTVLSCQRQRHINDTIEGEDGETIMRVGAVYAIGVKES